MNLSVPAALHPKSTILLTCTHLEPIGSLQSNTSRTTSDNSTTYTVSTCYNTLYMQITKEGRDSYSQSAAVYSFVKPCNTHLFLSKFNYFLFKIL